MKGLLIISGLCFSLCSFRLADNKKVRRHDHLIGQYRDTVHNLCNLNYHIKLQTMKIPSVIRNLKGYETHLILSAVKACQRTVK